MSSKFLTFIFIILVSVQLSSCGWSLWGSEKKENLSTEKNFKDEEPNSSASLPIEDDTNMIPPPKDSSVASSDDNEDEASSTVKPTTKTTENEFKMPNEELDEYPEEESYKSLNSEKEIESIPAITSSTDKIVKYLSSVSTQIPDSSTTTTEESESVSPSTDNTNTPATSENTLNVTDVNNVPRSVGEGSAKSDDTSVENSAPSSTDDIFNTQNSVVANSSETTLPNITYSPNDQKVNSSIDDDPTSSDKLNERGDNLAPRDVTDDKGNSTHNITENYESETSSTAMTNTPTTAEIMPNSTSNNEARNVIDDTGNYDNSSKSETLSDLDPSESLQANTTIKTILSTSTDTMSTTEMAGSMSNVTTPEVNYGSFVNSGSTGNSYSQLILNLCILIFSISVIV